MGILTGRLARPAAIAFDLDGTLVDTVPVRIRAGRQALHEAGILTTEQSVAHLIGSDGRFVAQESARAAGRPISAPRSEAIDHRQGEIFDALNVKPRPLPASRALLMMLDGRNVPWVIATSSRPEQVGVSVRALRLPRPPAIVDGLDAPRGKPAPDLLLKAARVLGVPPARCWYIGDSTWDMVAAKAAKMPAVAVTAGSAVGAGDLREAGATVVCTTLRGVMRLVRREPPTRDRKSRSGTRPKSS